MTDGLVKTNMEKKNNSDEGMKSKKLWLPLKSTDVRLTPVHHHPSPRRPHASNHLQVAALQTIQRAEAICFPFAQMTDTLGGALEEELLKIDKD